METPISLTSVDITTRPSRPRPTFSCVRCAERKVKCDRQQPCHACIRHKIDCTYKIPPPSKKRHRQNQDPALIKRLKDYEALLQANGIDPSQTINAVKPNERVQVDSATEIGSEELDCASPSSVPGSVGRVNKTQLILNRDHSQFVDNSLWTRIVEEQTPEELLENSVSNASDSEDFSDGFSFVLETNPTPRPRCHHPPGDRIMDLFQIFVANVDPLTKIVHIPTLRTAVEKVSSDPDSASRAFQALLFAIYAAAIMSMSEDDCQQKFDQPRQDLLSHWLLASKTSLGRAKFMSTTSLVVLQALSLHLIAVRDICDPRTAWSLSGVALRIAQGMGLDRDGSLLGLPAFDTEMRRRIWWQLKMQDYQIAEVVGLSKFRDLDTSLEATKWPSNINDDQIHPGMTAPPFESKGLTDMAFMALRGEMTLFVSRRASRLRGLSKSSSDWDLSAACDDKTELASAIKELVDVVEGGYLRYCDPSQSLHLMLMLMARKGINTVHFRTNHPRRWVKASQTPLVERQHIWEVSLKLLEQHSMLQINPQLKGFLWHTKHFIPWHALIHVLDTLVASPLATDAQKAWQSIGDLYISNAEMMFEPKRSMSVAVSKLCLKAYHAREKALQDSQLRAEMVPDFIKQLRAQDAIAKDKTQARRAKMYQDQVVVDCTRMDDGDQAGHLTQGIQQLDDGVQYDPNWFSHGLAGGQNDLMNLDVSYNHVGYDGQAISWDQWDKLFAE